jgi:DNA-directed RNA polymerase sigma subunit (sigma70/sigma32)
VLGDFIEDEDTITPEESATNQLLKEHVKDLLSGLTDREQKMCLDKRVVYVHLEDRKWQTSW